MAPTQRRKEPTPGSPFFSLLIGIGQYEVFPGAELRRAVLDVMSFKDYIETTLDVPTEQVITLTNERATRSNIIAALKDLALNPNIQYGDAILIFYSGRGMECGPPHENTMAILPYDYDATRVGGGRVPPITDRTLGYLLGTIARTHGNNIIVIIDACHSASSTTVPPRSDSSGLEEVDLFTRPASLDQQILLSPSVGDTGIAFQGSHVQISACASNGLAYESYSELEGKSRRIRSGCYSTNLLKLLYHTPPHRVLPADILNSLGSFQNRNPYCAGQYRRKYLSGAKAQPVIIPNSFEVVYRSGSRRIDTNRNAIGFRRLSRGYYIINAGKIHNITVHSQFAVYFDNDVMFARSIGKLVAVSVENVRTLALPPRNSSHFNIEPSPRKKVVAVPIKSGDGDSQLVWKDPTFVFLEDLHKHMKNKHKAQLQNVAMAMMQHTVDIELGSEWIEKITTDDIDLLSRVLYHESNFLWRPQAPPTFPLKIKSEK